MTIANTTRLVEYTGNGVQTSFYAGFAIPAKADCLVSLVEISTGTVSAVASGDFGFVTSGNENGATVTYPLVGSPVSNLYKIRITRKVQPLQTFSQSNQDAYDAGSVEAVFDRMVLMAQDSYATAETALSTVNGNSAFVDFDQRYLGAKPSDPGLDNNGNALIDGALYFNTTTNIMKVYDLGTTSWGDIAGLTGPNNLSDVASVYTSRANLGVYGRVLDSATNITLDATHAGTVLNCTATQTVTLPAVAGLSANYMVRVYAFAGTITIDGNASETINGATTVVINAGSHIDLYATSTGWIGLSPGAQLVTNIDVTSSVANYEVDVPAGKTRARLWIDSFNPVSASNVNLRVRFGDNGTFVTTSNYHVVSQNNVNGTTSGTSANYDGANLTLAIARASGLSEMMHGVIDFQGFNTASGRATFTGQTQGFNASSQNNSFVFSGRLFTTAGNYDGMLFYLTTGNFDTFKARIEWFD